MSFESVVVNEATAAIEGGSRVLEGLSADGDPLNEVRTGTNTVYRLVEGGTTRYVGMTNNLPRRAAEHMGGRGWRITPMDGLEHLSPYDARAVEQVLIEHYGLGNLYNKINSIAADSPIYQESIIRGKDILKQVGFYSVE